MRVARYGKPEVLELHERPVPEPAEGEVRVSVEAAGINFADILARMGLYPDAGDPPFTVGYEFAGRVDATGPGVEGLKQGDPVVGVRNFGSYAEKVVTAADLILPMPAGMDAVTGAAWPVSYFTAWHCLIYLGNLHPGDRVLIQNAGGALGAAAIQVARHRGARIIGAASAAKHEFLRSQGVQHVVDYTSGDWQARVEEISRELGPGKGVELVLDPIGGRHLKQGYELLAHTGRVITCGVSSMAPGFSRRSLLAAKSVLTWPRFPLLRMMQKNRGVMGVHIGHLWHRTDVLRAEFEELLPLLEDGTLRPTVDTTFPLERAAEAHRYIQERRNRGKVVLTVE